MPTYPINRSIPLRVSPTQKTPILPKHEYGLCGWMCEHFRKETGEGEWKMWGFVNKSVRMTARKKDTLTKEDLKENVEESSRNVYFEEKGSWAFILDGQMIFHFPQDRVLHYFGLTRETLLLLLESL